MKEEKFLRIVTVVSIVIPVAVALAFWIPRPETRSPDWLYELPLFHASLNAASFCLILTGYLFILRKKVLQHRTCMLAAAGLTAVFLVSYLIYHSTVPQMKFGGVGVIRYFYFTLLVSHVILAAVIVPVVLITMYRGLTGKVERHRKIARWTLPMWLYVAITGVMVYLMMSPYYAT